MILHKIKECRVSAGITQNQLADKINVKRSVISKYETNAISPSLHTINKIANALNVNMSNILNEFTA